MQSCPNCAHLLSQRGHFCPACGAQARCKSCHELLEQNAIACVECGTLVGEGDVSSFEGRLSSTAAPNLLRLEETRNSRTLEIRFTDTAVENLSAPLTAYLSAGVANTFQGRSRLGHGRGGQSVETQLPILLPGEEEVIDVPLSDLKVNSGLQQPVPSDDGQRLRAILSYEGTRLRLKDSRIKADTKIEYVARVSTLFVYAHELEGRLKVLRGDLNAFLTEATLYDANARRWIAATTDFMTEGDTIELTVPGRERAVETLQRQLDPNVTGTFVLGSGSKARVSKKETGLQEDGPANTAAKTGKRQPAIESKKVAGWVSEWNSTGITVDAYSLLKAKNAGEKGLFGLWAIRKARGENGKVVTRVQLAQFLYQAFEIKLTDAAYSSAFKLPSMKGRVLHLGGTRFQITPDGIAFVEQMIGAPVQPAANSVSANGPAMANP